MEKINLKENVKMEIIIEKIKKILFDFKISNYTISKNTGISQSMLSMIFNYKRKIQPVHFYAIIEQLPITLGEKNTLIDEFKRSYYSYDEYMSFKYIIDMFKQLSDFTLSDSIKSKQPVMNDIAPSFEDKVYKGSDISLVINRLFANEFKNHNSKIYVYLGFDSDNSLLHTCIDSVIKQYDHSSKIFMLIDFINDSKKTAYNLKTLKNILPVALSDSSQSYEFYYTNTDATINNNYLIPYPYFIALSNYIIFINASQDEILLHSHPETVKNIRARCEGRIVNYTKLMDINSNIFSIVSEIVRNQSNFNDIFCSLEYEPCMSLHFTPELVDSVIPEDAPFRKEVFDVLMLRLNQLKSFKQSIQVFNKDALLNFANTGMIAEYPSEYARALTVEERLFILNNLLKCAKSGKHTFRVLNPANLLISDCVSMYQSNGFVQFTMWNSKKSDLKYYTIFEKTIYESFYKFMNALPDSNYVFGNDETIKIIEEAIASLSSRQKTENAD
ncbi:MAG: hypothetical protein IJ583_05675 [Firmicutes bacterium]|nr:hypothetical protein [Bacillota bacterium]